MYNDLMSMERIKKNSLLCIGAIIVFLFFYRISSWMPMAGDDWGYALGGMYNNPFLMAWNNYLTWAGRILSELWGFLLAPHKGIWNIANSLLFTVIFIFMVVLTDHKRSFMTIALAALLMLTVSNGVRIQTYTWVMGSTYVVPLCLFMIYLYLLKRWIFEDHLSNGMFAVMCLFNLFIPLYMENAAAMLVGADALVLIYLWFNDRQKLKKMLILFVIGVIGTCIIKFSPGATFRMNRDHAEFNALSLLDKFKLNWENFIHFTFMADNVLTGVMSLVLLVYTIQHREKLSKIVFMLGILFFCYGIVQSLAWRLMEIADLGIFYILADIHIPHSVEINTFAFFGQFVMMVIILLQGEEDRQVKWFAIFVYLCAMGADIVMCISPIFDARSSLYSLYTLMLFVLTIANRIQMPKNASVAISVLALFFTARIMYQWYGIYQMVDQVTQKRMSQIAYYQDHPESEEAWFIAYPDQSIHSGNIEPEDTYHIETFKSYYGLDENLQIHFYWLEEYTQESINAG